MGPAAGSPLRAPEPSAAGPARRAGQFTNVWSGAPAGASRRSGRRAAPVGAAGVVFAAPSRREVGTARGRADVQEPDALEVGQKSRRRWIAARSGLAQARGASDEGRGGLRDDARMGEPLILLDPWPRTLDLLCDGPMRARLEALGRLVVHEGGRMPAETVDAHLPEAAAIVGQTTMDASRIARARRLRAIVNVEGNFLANVDYEACHARGIHALVAPAFAPAVAEAALGMAIDLARGITAADRAMRTG